MTAQITHRTIETNGIQLHLAEQGEGPLVVLCHGFPESWYSWRHQLAALAEAGFHAVAPDMRGYGQTGPAGGDRAIHALHLVGDMVGLLDALGAEQAVIAGHDWGAPVAWHAALLRPDRFRAVIGLSVPFRPRGPVAPDLGHAADATMRYSISSISRRRASPRRNSSAIRAHTIRSPCFASRATCRAEPDRTARRRHGAAPRRLSHAACRVPPPLPAWLTEADVDFYAGEFARTGFRGGLNWYRNIDRNWELLAPFAGARVTVPALYIAGDRDLVVAFRGMDQLIANLANSCPQLARHDHAAGCGHWTQQERAAEVNAAMIDFLREL